VDLPRWWNWPFVLTGHAGDRLEERGLHEIELRTMLQDPLMVQPAEHVGRWYVLARSGRSGWKILLEPDPRREVVLVVTAFRVTP
jgi:hypothetical protein